MNLAVSPEVTAWHYLDAAVQAMRRREFQHALAYLDVCLTLTPDDPHAHWNRAITHLSLGNYQAGFAELDWRWKLFHHCWGLLDEDVIRAWQLPRWKGESLVGKNLLLVHEQGFGDAIMMLRYLPRLLALAGSVTLLTVKPLQSLSRQYGAEVIVKLPDDLGRFDYFCTMFDPMVVLRETIATVPGSPYMAANWRCDPQKLGIVWSGNSRNELTRESFLGLLKHQGYELYALQLAPPGPGVHALQSDDFAETASLMQTLGTIVTVDSASANLAGALGHPNTHVLLPYLKDWRWYSAVTWYPHLKLHQQKNPSDWKTPFAEINATL